MLVYSRSYILGHVRGTWNSSPEGTITGCKWKEEIPFVAPEGDSITDLVFEETAGNGNHTDFRLVGMISVKGPLPRISLRRYAACSYRAAQDTRGLVCPRLR